VLVIQVWVHAGMESDGRVWFAADSDSELTRGLAAVLVEALSGVTPEQILQVGLQHSACCGHLQGTKGISEGMQPHSAQDIDRIANHCRWSQKR
jgi:sulfur transfer protein SufE